MLETSPLSTNPETPLSPPSSQPLIPPTPPTIIIFALLILAVAAASFLLGKYSTKPATSPSPTPQPFNMRGVPIATPTENPTANWKTYTNNLSSYSIKYPQNWLLLDLTEGKQIEIYYQPDETISVGEILIEKVDSLSYNRELGSNQVIKDTLIGNANAKCKTDNIAKTWCFLTSNSRYLSILIVKEKDQEYNKILDQILSTFRFD